MFSKNTLPNPEHIALSIGQTTIKLAQGDITKQTNMQGIVNAAKPSLMGGGGIDGAIHAADGYQNSSVAHNCTTCALCKACTQYTPDANRERCPTGQARITSAHYLKTTGISHIIHTVGPLGSSPEKEKLLRNAYTNCLELAKEHQLATIAFPSISTGIYGYPIAQAATIALATVLQYVKKYPAAFAEIRFVLFSHDDFVTYAAELEKLSR